MTDPLLSVQNVSFAHGEKSILNAIDFAAESGEFIALLGINGAGKSTLLDIIASLRAAGSGDVRLKGRRLKQLSARDRSRLISHLPQGAHNELPFTVEQIVLMGRYAHADSWFESAEDRAYADNAMQRMDCLQFRDRPISTLSGGEQQRVLLAACVAQCPAVMLFDEPSTYLDIHQQLHCFTTLAELAREGALCIAITHDLNLALAYCSRILVLGRGQLVADLSVTDASRDTNWLLHLSPRLRLLQTPGGKPWVLYQ